MYGCDPSGCVSWVPKFARNIHLRERVGCPLSPSGFPQSFPSFSIFTRTSGFQGKGQYSSPTQATRVGMSWKKWGALNQYEEPPVICVIKHKEPKPETSYALPSRQTSYCPTDVKHTKAPRCYVLYTNELERTIHHNGWLFHSGLNTASGIWAKTCTLPS